MWIHNHYIIVRYEGKEEVKVRRAEKYDTVRYGVYTASIRRGGRRVELTFFYTQFIQKAQYVNVM